MSAQEIPLPRAGLTLLPPWWCFILWAGKRIENRSATVAARCGRWRGRVAIGASRVVGPKGCDRDDVCMLAKSYEREPWWRWRGSPSFSERDMFALGGHLVGVADLLDVRPNGPRPSDPWAEPGEWAFVLGTVYEIEPVPCTGGRRIHAIGGCATCGHIGAIEERNDPLRCRRCKASTPRSQLRRPPLRVIRAFGADGEPCPLTE